MILTSCKFAVNQGGRYTREQLPHFPIIFAEIINATKGPIPTFYPRRRLPVTLKGDVRSTSPSVVAHPACTGSEAHTQVSTARLNLPLVSLLSAAIRLSP